MIPNNDLAETMRSVVTMARMEPMALLLVEACKLAEQVSAGDLPFVSAVDLAYGVAINAGLCETQGDDAVQAVLASAFMAVPKGDHASTGR